ncbi:MAG: gas vesicle protein K [Bacillota bacterium]
MPVIINEDNLKQGLLGLVVALVEVIREILELQALKRIEAGVLNDDEVERLGTALMDLEEAMMKIKIENNLLEVVGDVRKSLDELVEDVLERMINPERWRE